MYANCLYRCGILCEYNMIGQLARYSFINAKIRAMLSYLLNAAVLERLASAHDQFEVLEELAKTSYRTIIGPIDADAFDSIECQRRLQAADYAAHQSIAVSLGTGVLFDFVMVLSRVYAMHDLKVVLRAWHKKTDFDAQRYLVCPDGKGIEFKKILACRTFEEVILVLDDTPFKRPLIKALAGYTQSGSLFPVEMALEADYYQRIFDALAFLSALDRSIAKRIIGIEIDIENITRMMCMRKYYDIPLGQMLEYVIAGGNHITADSVRLFYSGDGLSQVIESIARGPYRKVKELMQGNIQLVEAFLYDVLHREIRRQLAGFPFTIGVVLGYSILKRRETSRIGSLIQAKSYGWSRQKIMPIIGEAGVA